MGWMTRVEVNKDQGGCEQPDQGGCEQRIEVIVKMQKKGRRGSGLGGQGGCEHRIEVIVKMKKSRGTRWGGQSGLK